MSMNTLNRKQWWWIGGVAVVVALVLLGVWWRSYGKQAVLRGAFEALAQAPTFHTREELVIYLPKRTSSGRERPFTRVTFRTEGDVQKTGGMPEYSGKMLIAARGRGNVFFADGDIRFLTDAAAFNLKNLPVFVNPSGSLINRWTYVPSTALHTQNGAEVKEAFAGVAQAIAYRGKEKRQNHSTYRFSGSFTPEQEEQLQTLLAHTASGNQAFNVLARLLRANNIQSLDMWIDTSSKELVEVQAQFVRPLGEGKEFHFAQLTLSFTDYGKDVTIEVPPRQLTAKPATFARLFGTGEVEKVEQ